MNEGRDAVMGSNELYPPSLRGAKRRSNPSRRKRKGGLLRCARNDECRSPHERSDMRDTCLGYRCAHLGYGQAHTFPRRNCTRVLHHRSPSTEEGAGNTGCWLHPQALRAKNVCILRTQAVQVQPKQPAFPAQWFYGLYVVSSVRRASGHRRLMFVTRGLISASGDRDRTISPSAKMLSSTRFKRAEHPRVHRIPLPTSVTIAIRPSWWRRDGRDKSMKFRKAEAEYFSREGLT